MKKLIRAISLAVAITVMTYIGPVQAFINYSKELVTYVDEALPYGTLCRFGIDTTRYNYAMPIGSLCTVYRYDDTVVTVYGVITGE